MILKSEKVIKECTDYNGHMNVAYYVHVFDMAADIMLDNFRMGGKSTISLFHYIRSWNKKNIKNYVEIYIKADIKKIIRKKKKFFYKRKTENVIGVNIKPELPKLPNIIIKNDFKKSINKLSEELLKKINSHLIN